MIEAIDKILPQTQCEECGYKGCKPYAAALANSEAEINLCPPGGVEVVQKLSEILKIDATPYLEDAAANIRPPAIVSIREAECIGCTKCIQACPVDAIVGSNKLMHSVFQAECTGCLLCVEPCPVDCIDVSELEQATFDKDLARSSFDKRNIRLEKQKSAKRASYIEKRNLTKTNDTKAKQDYILEAIKRKLAKK